MTTLLQTLEIPIPCTESWDAMQGDEQVRHCGLCRKNVYNLSVMPQAQAEALLAGHADGGVCVRFYRRGDGTVLTSDCGTSPRVRLRRVLRTLPRAAAGAAGVAGAAAVAVAAAQAKPPRLHAAPAPYVVVVALDQDPRPPMMGEPAIGEVTMGAPAAPVELMGKPVAPPEPVPPEPAHVDEPEEDGGAAPGPAADGNAEDEARS